MSYPSSSFRTDAKKGANHCFKVNFVNYKAQVTIDDTNKFNFERTEKISKLYFASSASALVNYQGVDKPERIETSIWLASHLVRAPHS
jgi:hypothetical protein